MFSGLNGHFAARPWNFAYDSVRDIVLHHGQHRQSYPRWV